jgi:hypothetical protein
MRFVSPHHVSKTDPVGSRFRRARRFNPPRDASLASPQNGLGFDSRSSFSGKSRKRAHGWAGYRLRKWMSLNCTVIGGPTWT